MSQKFEIILLLLVIISMEYAHAKTRRLLNDTIFQTSSINNTNNTENYVKKGDTMMKMKNNIQENNIRENLLKYRLQGTFSVVQDWNLVCKQLCGAGLGGPTCGEPQCENIRKGQTGNITLIAQRLLQTKENLICEDLCKYGLGGDICTCQPTIFSISGKSSPSIMWDRNQVCYTFCYHNDVTLIGCSLCSIINPTDVVSTSQPAVTKTTTPNWKEICNELCKTGDGGALCNCDKPPFF